jgi:hypothetical protein
MRLDDMNFDSRDLGIKQLKEKEEMVLLKSSHEMQL